MTTTSPPAEIDIARAKAVALAAALRDAGRVLVAFSGGVDSAYLACVAVDTLGASNVLAVIGTSASYPAEQWAAARDVAERIGLSVVEVRTDELADPNYVANPVNRCYFCKTELWTRLAPIAREHRFDVIVDGTNADEVSDYRPGAAAAREHGVRSPLADAGLTKREIRILSRARGLPTWAQPSSPCLSSRIPYGTPVTSTRLHQIEAAERALRSLGIGGDLRVRHHGDVARVELARDELPRWLDDAALAELTRAVRAAGFARVALDLRGFRSGSLNILEGIVAA
ncbi:MAG: ATP-dependent sacrificial sulfur transferase LarE [Gemmatimonadota bacterium]|nr:ATP-dependent sacrificial sulfur transferase LarE [Gemmatimonadota bacterium]